MENDIQYRVYRDIYLELRPTLSSELISAGSAAVRCLDGGDLRFALRKKDLTAISAAYPFVKAFITGVMKPRYDLPRGFGLTYAHLKIAFEGLPACLGCGEKLLRLVTTNRMIRFCSPRCGQLSCEVQSKRKANSVLSRGYEHSAQDPKVREKFKTTCVARYGATNPSKTEEVKERKIENSLKKHGVAHAGTTQEAVAKRKATMTERYGAEYSMQSSEIFDKYRATMLDRYGEKYPGQVKSIREKQAQHKTKTMQYDGKEYRYQGYENYLILNLLNKGFKVNTNLNGIPYNLGKKKYFADVAAVSPQGKKYLFEVKSFYTFNFGVQDGTLSAKSRAAKVWCADRGARFKVVIVNPKPLEFTIAKRYSS